MQNTLKKDLIAYQTQTNLIYQTSDVHAESYPYRGTRGRVGVEWTLPIVFYLLQYFENIQPSLQESL